MYKPKDCYIYVKLHVQRIRMLKLEITPQSVIESIVNGSKIKLTSSDVRMYDKTSICVSLCCLSSLFITVIFNIVTVE